MPTTSEGHLAHRVLYTFEKFTTELQKRGMPKKAADRSALHATLRLEGFTHEQAQEAVERRLPLILCELCQNEKIEDMRAAFNFDRLCLKDPIPVAQSRADFAAWVDSPDAEQQSRQPPS